MYCSVLSCSQLVPCALHGHEAHSQPTFFEKVKETAHHAAEAIKSVLPVAKKENTVVVQGEVIPEVKAHTVEEAVLHFPLSEEEGLASRTVHTQYQTAHTWDQQHKEEGGIRHRTSEAVKDAAGAVGETAAVVGEKVVEVLKDTAEHIAAMSNEALGTVEGKGHEARVKIDGALERHLGPTAEKINIEAEKARQSAIDNTARTAELVQEQFGTAASALRTQEQKEQAKTEAEKLAQYHSAPKGPLDDKLDRNFGTIAKEMELEGQKAKEGAISETAHAVELLQDGFGDFASALREQQQHEKSS
jgi:hypothetical protein